MTAEQETVAGGYDCTVLGSARDRYQCSVCQLVLRKPHLVSCCGAHFCEACIAKVSRQRVCSPTCPLCRTAEFTTMLNLGLEREINQLTVYCSHHEEGCPWSGHVTQLSSHGGECGYVKIECSWKCGAWVRKKDLEEHETKVCSLRPWYTDIADGNIRRLAKALESAANEKEELHHRLGLLEARVSTLETEKATLIHNLHEAQMQLAQLHTASQLKSENIAQELGNLNSKMNALGKQLSDVTQQGVENTTQLESLSREMAAVREKEQRFILDQESASIDPSPISHCDSESPLLVAAPSASDNTFPIPYDFTVDRCKQRQNDNADYYSLPFLTHKGGYKMCVRVCVNGMGAGKGTHLSVYVYMMRGENDDDLTWPFCGNIEIQLLNQIGESGHHVQIVDISESIHPSVAGRVRVGDRAARGQGYSQFISHLELKLDPL